LRSGRDDLFVVGYLSVYCVCESMLKNGAKVVIAEFVHIYIYIYRNCAQAKDVDTHTPEY